MIGGNIIGVGSKINRRSVIVYDKAKNYRLPLRIHLESSKDANAINQQVGAPAQNLQGTRATPNRLWLRLESFGQPASGESFGQSSSEHANRDAYVLAAARSQSIPPQP